MARTPRTTESKQMAKIVGKRIQALRTTSGLSQEALADVIGVHRTQVGFLERGENTTSIHTLSLIAKALGKKASTLLDECGY